MTTVSAMPVEAAGEVTERQPAGLADPRLLAWRDVLVASGATALRAFQEAWTAPGLDDADRAVAAIGLAHTAAAGGLPELPAVGLLAWIVAVTGIDAAAEAVLAAAWWSTVDPQVAVLLGCVHDDAARRYPTLGLLAVLLRPRGIAVPLAIREHHRLVAQGLCEPVPDADTPLRLPPVTSALLAGQRADPSPSEALAPRIAAVARRAAALIELGATVLVRCELLADRDAVRDAVAAHLGMSVWPFARPAPVARLLRRLGHELPAAVLDLGDELPAGCVLAVAGPGAAPSAGWHRLDLDLPSLDEAQLCWRQALRSAGLRPRPAEVADLAGRLPLSEITIGEIVDKAALAARAEGRVLTSADVVGTLRAHPRHDLGGLARRILAGVRLDELVLADVTHAGLTDLIAHARYSPAAHARMGLTGVRGRAVIALFHGPSGTGKTAAAEGVAAELDRDLWVVDLARVVSKWLGETQRNLDAVLTEAASAGVVLLFDEADGLFGKRGEVTDARDRYANLEIDHLLQRIELHPGVVVLTSNRPAGLDEAFARRIRLAVRFDLPGHAQREDIWRRLIPPQLLADGVTIDEAAREELSGAAIRSAALAATVAATGADGPVQAAHLRSAVARELEKLKRPPTAWAGQR